jgi:lysophospholipase L1-like esterase
MPNLLRFLVIPLFFMLIISPLRGQQDVILIDFGSPAELSPMPWNNVTDVTSGLISNLVNDMGFPTGKGIRITDRFNTTNTFGTSNPNPSLGYPVTATKDCFFGNVTQFGGHTLPTAGFELYNLDTNVIYTLEIFASRNHTINLQTEYVVKGHTTDTLYLDAASNSTQVVTATLKPDNTGVIAVQMTAGPDNTSANGFYYINALKLHYPHVPSNAPKSLSLKAPNGGEFWQAGKSPFIVWESTQIHTVALEYSTDLGNSWVFIDSLKHYETPFSWTVPNTPSQQCLVRISYDTLVSVSANPFEISTDTTTCTIVVLGSSTAAGAGASPPDSSWVNRYRYAMHQQNTSFEVINLARGGYTTYHILPTGTTPPPHVTIETDTIRNITKALSYNPYGIIINMPSNDASNGFTAAEQMVNFNLLYQTAIQAGAKAWICTPQPRNFISQSKIQIQYDLFDSIMLAFPDVAIDFWTGLADPNGYILPQYDSGDGIHLNNTGYLLLFQRVTEARTDTPGCIPHIGIPLHKPAGEPAVIMYPNPFNKTLNININNNEPQHFTFTITDLLGRVLDVTSLFAPQTGEQHTTWTPNLPANLAPQLLCIIITATTPKGDTTRKVIKMMYGGF